MSVKPPSSDPQSLTMPVLQAGLRIGFTPGTTKKYLDEGRFPLQVEKLGRNRVCLRSDVDAFVYKKLFGRDIPCQEQTKPDDAVVIKRSGGRPRKVAPEPSV